MSLPLDTCLELTIDIEAFLDLSIDMPGGVIIAAKLEPNTLPTLAGIVTSMLGPLNAAMTPLMPFFRLLDLVICIVRFCEGVPPAIASLDIGELLKLLKAVMRAFAKVVGLVPPITVPVMLAGVCRTVSAALLALVLALEDIVKIQFALDSKQARIDFLLADPELHEGAALLQSSIDCAQADIDLQAKVGFSSLGPINKFYDLMNEFIKLIKLPELAKVEGNTDPAAMIAPIRQAAEVLAAFCTNLPI